MCFPFFKKIGVRIRKKFIIMIIFVNHSYVDS